uniref:Uncharacterized protein n=1 Tax=Anguilla anguilla TaxID=7936 RepID=A0A0E9T6G9_ANGAN
MYFFCLLSSICSECRFEDVLTISFFEAFPAGCNQPCAHSVIRAQV